ncbi:hypothetical protein ACJX0J_016408, partial [Zea mays]
LSHLNSGEIVFSKEFEFLLCARAIILKKKLGLLTNSTGLGPKQNWFDQIWMNINQIMAFLSLMYRLVRRPGRDKSLCQADFDDLKLVQLAHLWFRLKVETLSNTRGKAQNIAIARKNLELESSSSTSGSCVGGGFRHEEILNIQLYTKQTKNILFELEFPLGNYNLVHLSCIDIK